MVPVETPSVEKKKAGRHSLGREKIHTTFTPKGKAIARKKAFKLGITLGDYLEQLVRRDNADALSIGTQGGVAP